MRNERSEIENNGTYFSGILLRELMLRFGWRLLLLCLEI